MNESWNTMALTSAMLMNRHGAEQVSDADLSSLLGGRKFGNKQQGQEPFQMNPEIPAYDPAEMQELQDFCAKRGIIGVNFNGMNPSAVLRMLKAKMGINEQTSKRGILHG